jgi:hypothetical protein
MDRKDIIRMAREAGARDCANPDKWGVFEISYEGLFNFAELIVLECLRYLNEDYERDFNTLWLEDLTKGIEKHFGIEAKAYSEVDLADAYEKGWNDAMLRNSLEKNT